MKSKENLSIMPINSIFINVIRLSIGNSLCLSRTPDVKEWQEIYAMAKKQSLVGVCFAGVQKTLSNSPSHSTDSGQVPGEDPSVIGMPKMLYLTWMGMAAKIQQRNEVVNRQCVELQKWFQKEGIRSCILKGQGNSKNYESLAMLRQSGDIDIWLEGGFESINSYIQTNWPTKDINDHHIHVKIYHDTDVEVHYIPFLLNNPLKNKILVNFFRKEESIQFAHKITLPSRDIITVADYRFNIVFQLVHIFHHLLTEGVGLRQLMDYYFVLKHEIEVEKVSNFHEGKEIISELGLERFASALMWVLGHVFGLPEEQMPWKPNEKDGKFLLEEIMLSGNFGKQDERQRGLYDSKWNSFWMVHVKTFRLWRFDHWAWLWSPIWRIKGFVWRKLKGYK